ncbi:zinc-binding alcohol dehydrogenase family protein [Janthinobacterium sp. 1_2014MBL_MicDiv]|uniref:zinc-binding alcohol dehydrogenase family protein n=1 Tax=Janthinobacterium sp. 1_2014MBL_MicDiv TaxID=1644131 RepID=UPI0008F52284|nr:zinc-binding alcohol dehydrogenase family protein [Janthinobacterium sp. 1_2014MBL_MicDiv]APA69451.1 NADPH:quinone reductase [Janthinobacterium sp. 1_2014MBL_MicDiv]
MKMIGFSKGSGVDDEHGLFDTTGAMPVPGPRDVLVRVRAVGVNPLDVKVRAGLVPVPDGVVTLGWDAAGVVHAVGSAVTLFAPGQAVYYAGSFDRAGANAAYHLVDERIAGRMPATLDFAQAAGVPLAALTAWQLLFERFAIAPGDRQPRGSLLVLGGAGGVGSMLIQLARQLTGLTVIATASRGDSMEWCRAMGAHHVIDHTLPLPAQVAALNVAPVAHVAALSHTARHCAALVELIAPHGKLAVIDDHAMFDAAPLKGKSVSLHWEMVFTRPLYGTADLLEQQRILHRVAGLIDEGVLRHTVRRRFSPIDAATLRQAHALLERGGQAGKVVLSDE